MSTHDALRSFQPETATSFSRTGYIPVRWPRISTATPTITRAITGRRSSRAIAGFGQQSPRPAHERRQTIRRVSGLEICALLRTNQRGGWGRDTAHTMSCRLATPPPKRIARIEAVEWVPPRRSDGGHRTPVAGADFQFQVPVDARQSLGSICLRARFSSTTGEDDTSASGSLAARPWVGKRISNRSRELHAALAWPAGRVFASINGLVQ